MRIIHVIESVLRSNPGDRMETVLSKIISDPSKEKNRIQNTEHNIYLALYSLLRLELRRSEKRKFKEGKEKKNVHSK
jgi:hypothetical protein